MIEFSLKTSGTIKTLTSSGYGKSVVAQIMKEFEESLTVEILTYIKDYLGSSRVYQLNPQYAQRKPSLSGYKRYGGRAADQPLILTGAMVDAIKLRRVGEEFTIYVDVASMATPNAAEYVAHWLETTDFLGIPYQEIEDRVQLLFERILVRLMGL